MRLHSMKRRGFTVVEVISAITIIAIMGLVASGLVVRVSTASADSTNRMALHTELATSMERIDKLLRQIGKKTGATNPNITTLTATSITFNTNTTIALIGTDLTLAENGGPAITLLSGVTSLSIAAFNEANTAMSASLSGSACDPIRRLQVTITAGRNGVSDTLRTKVYLRSTMSGAGPG